MCVIFGGTWSTARVRQAVARRCRRAEIAALEEDAAILRRQARALRGIIGPVPSLPVLAAPRGSARIAELAVHEGRLRAAVLEGWRQLESAVDRGLAAQPGREAPGARLLLARNLSRCDPADVERLARLASDPARPRQLEAEVAASVDRGQRARQAATSRARLGALAGHALPAERRALSALVVRADEAELPSVANQVFAAVSRADQYRSRLTAARAMAAALKDLGCAAAPGGPGAPESAALAADALAALLAAGIAIVPLQWPPGYGIRAVVADGEFSAAIVRRAGVPGEDDARVREAVGARASLALARLRRAGMTRAGRAGHPPAPIPVISDDSWNASGLR